MNTKNKETHEDIELLLPWHAAGTLSRRDTQRVEQALANDNELAARYEIVREELGEAIRLNESLGAPSARAMETLFAKIDAEPARKPKASFNLGAWLAGFVAGFSPRTLAYSGTIAALAIVLQAGVITGVLINDRQQDGPSLASYEVNTRGIDGSSVLIRFKPQATSGEITKFLRDNKFVVLDGPNGGGMYRVRVSEAILSQADLAAVVNRLAKSRVVGSTFPEAHP
jgi:anti-sigma-K factor RskA